MEKRLLANISQEEGLQRLNNRLLLLVLPALVFSIQTAHAQVPQGIPYQAEVHNSEGAPVRNSTVSVRFTIHDSVAAGTAVYKETCTPVTNSAGVFAVNIGQGTPVTGTFAGINWGQNAKFLQIELDPAGGTSYTDMGTTQFMSVPYALYAGNAATAACVAQVTRIGFWTSTTWTCPDNVFQITVELWGGAGGGGGYIYAWSYGGKGGNGGYNKQIVTVLPGTTYSIIIGNGGTWSMCCTGQNGGSTSFDGVIFASGGTGGVISYSAGYYGWPTVGANGSGGGVINFDYQNINQNSSIGGFRLASTIPTNYLTAVPTCCTVGGNGAGQTIAVYSGTNGEAGYCVISY